MTTGSGSHLGRFGRGQTSTTHQHRRSLGWLSRSMHHTSELNCCSHLTSPLPSQNHILVFRSPSPREDWKPDLHKASRCPCTSPRHREQTKTQGKSKMKASHTLKPKRFQKRRVACRGSQPTAHPHLSALLPGPPLAPTGTPVPAAPPTTQLIPLGCTEPPSSS